MGEDRILEESMEEKEVSENEEQEKPISELTLLTNPLYLKPEDIEDIIKSKEYKTGYKKGLELVGIYTALINSGIDAITANNIVIYEHSNQWKLTHIEADNEIKARIKIEKELKGI